MEYFWYMLGYSGSESMPVNYGDSAKIRAVKRVMKRPIQPTGDEAKDDYSRPHPDFQMTFEAPDQDLLLEIIQSLRKVTINGHKLKRRVPRTPSPVIDEDTTSEEELLTLFVPQDEHLSEAIDQLNHVVPIVREPYVYATNTVYHDICARRWEPETEL